MKEEHINFNSQEIENLLNELYDKAFEKGFNNSKAFDGDQCEADPREGVILSEGGEVEGKLENNSKTKEKADILTYIHARLFDILNDTMN